MTSVVKNSSSNGSQAVCVNHRRIASGNGVAYGPYIPLGMKSRSVPNDVTKIFNSKHANVKRHDGPSLFIARNRLYSPCGDFDIGVSIPFGRCWYDSRGTGATLSSFNACCHWFALKRWCFSCYLEWRCSRGESDWCCRMREVKANWHFESNTSKTIKWEVGLTYSPSHPNHKSLLLRKHHLRGVQSVWTLWTAVYLAKCYDKWVKSQ